jgi:putative endonuclease
MLVDWLIAWWMLVSDTPISATIKYVKPETKTTSQTRSPFAWVLYLLECENGSYYAGITTDLERRFAEHVFGFGARYTRANPPRRVIAVKAFPDRASASRAEAALKKLPRSRKVAFFAA